MSVVGIDFGNLNTVIAVARNRGVDVVCSCLEMQFFVPRIVCPALTADMNRSRTKSPTEQHRKFQYPKHPNTRENGIMADFNSSLVPLLGLAPRVDILARQQRHRRSRT